jgi:hypothetical protein
VRLTLYPFDINRSAAEFDGNPQFQAGVYDRFKQLALFLKSQNKGTVAATAAAIQQLADHQGCVVTFTRKPINNRFEKVVIETKKEEV